MEKQDNKAPQAHRAHLGDQARMASKALPVRRALLENQALQVLKGL